MEMQGKVVLAVGAHPDDLEFFAGGTIAKYVSAGAKVYYLLLTDGSKGAEDHKIAVEELIQIRKDEQLAAAKVLTISAVTFLDEVDGELENTLELRKKIVEIVRKVKPEVVITFDPSYLYDADWGMVNHPDHRAAGQATLDAVFPYARNRRTFPELLEKGQDIHSVSTLLLINLKDSNYMEDISLFIDKKVESLSCHKSQKDDSPEVINLMKKLCVKKGKKYCESYVKIELA